MNELSEHVLNNWDDDNQCAYCFLYRVGNDGPVEQFVKRFKVPNFRIENKKFVPDESYANQAQQILSACLRKHYSRIREEHNCRYLVPIPSHRQGYGDGNLLRVARLLSAEFGFDLLDRALLRTKEITISHKARYGERPKHQAHVQTLSWVWKDRLQGGILLVDDVITTGTTSQACRHVIAESTGIRSDSFVRLFLAKVNLQD